MKPLTARQAAPFDGQPVIILTHTGAHSRLTRKSPLTRIEHNGSYAVIASNGGAHKTPLWARNIAAKRRGAAAAGDTESDCLRGRLDEARRLVDRAGSQTPLTAHDVIDAVLAPIMYQIIFLPSTLTDDYAESLTTKLFTASR